MKKRLRLLFVIDSLNSGGAEKSLVSLLQTMDHTCYSVDLLMFAPEGLYMDQLPDQVRVLERPKFFGWMEKSLLSLIKAKRLKQLFLRIGCSLTLRLPFLRKVMHQAQITWVFTGGALEKLKTKYDIAIAYSQGMPTYFVAEKVNAGRKICWVNTDYRQAPYNKRFDSPFYAQYQHIVAVSDSNMDVFVNEMPEYEKKTTVFYDILPVDRIKELAEDPGGFSDGFQGTRILTIGRLVEVKGYELALEACKKLKEKGFLFRWYVLGKGPLQEEIQRYVAENKLEDHFILLGEKSNPYPYIKNADIYVQTSRYEGFGLAIAEARMLNVPVVTTRFDAVYNQMIHEKNGLVVDMDAESISDGILRMAEDKGFRKQVIKYLINEKKGNLEEIDKFYCLLRHKT